jgi:hypothetical protein
MALFLRVGRITFWSCTRGSCALVGISLLVFPHFRTIVASLLLFIWVVVAVRCKFSELVVFLVHSHWLMELIRSNLRLDKCSIWIVLPVRLQLNYGMAIVNKVPLNYPPNSTFLPLNNILPLKYASKFVRVHRAIYL